MLANNICAYVDTSLMGQMDTWYTDGVTGNVITYDGRLDGQLPAGDEVVEDEEAQG